MICDLPVPLGPTHPVLDDEGKQNLVMDQLRKFITLVKFLGYDHMQQKIHSSKVNFSCF